MINVCIIGYGLSARTFHEPFIRCSNGLHLKAIVSSKPTQELPNDIIHYTDIVDVLNDDGIDLVINTAPTALHFLLGKQVLQAKKHLLLEKPMVTSVEEGLALIQLAQTNDRIFSVYHNRRFTGDFQTVKNLLNKQKMGAVYRAELHFDRFRPTVRNRWRENAGEGSGILYDLGSHLIDQALQLFGDPEKITARCIALRPSSQSVDYFNIQMHYRNKEVILQSSPYHSAPNPTFTIEGDKGTFVKYGLDPQEEQLKAGLSVLDEKFGVESSSHHGTYYDGNGVQTIIPTATNSYLNYYQNLTQAIQKKSPLNVTPEQALEVINIIELAQKSSDTGKTLNYIKVT